jgi:hypothetical protein
MALKVFNLGCDQQHCFEGWFGSSEDFDSQQQRGLLTCPVCGSSQVDKLPSAPYIGSSGATDNVPRQTTQVSAAMPTAAQLQAMFLRVAREVAASTEDVGERFAEEARRIHYNEVPERGIRGLASKDEAEALADEGIAVMPLPFGDLLKDPLQ